MELYLGDCARYPPLICKVPSIVGTVESVNAPVLIVTLFNVEATEPLIVPAPAKYNVPLPRVKVPLLVKVPDAAIVMVPPDVMSTVPLMASVDIVIVPPEPIVNVFPLLTVTDAGAFETLLFKVRL